MSARALSQSLRTRCLFRKPQNAQSFSTRSNFRSAGHGDQYDPPAGYLFGVKPGQKYVKEGWENIWYYGFFGSLVLAGVAYVFKPDTSYVPSLCYCRILHKEMIGFFTVSFLRQLPKCRLTFHSGYRHGPWKRHEGDWKPRES